MPTSSYFGTDEFSTIIHEFGHTLGLKHGHESSLHGALAPQFNDNEFSVMTYANYLGAPVRPLDAEARDGSSPQSYMMFDISALQAMYGANFSKARHQGDLQLEREHGPADSSTASRRPTPA